MSSSDDRSTVRSERVDHADVYTSIYTRAFAHISSFIFSKFGALISSDNSGEFMAFLATAEICDSNSSHLASGDLRVLQPVFQIYGQCRAFSGPIVTLKVFEDNVLVRELLESRGEGRVLVIDGGGSMRCALVGGNLAQLAQNMNWAGIIVNGCIRDVDEINGCDIGVRALATHPQKSGKKGIGEKHVPVYVGGTLVRDGEWLYADSDGVLISKRQTHLLKNIMMKKARREIVINVTP